jgi:hypothetical protein
MSLYNFETQYIVSAFCILRDLKKVWGEYELIITQSVTQRYEVVTDIRAMLLSQGVDRSGSLAIQTVQWHYQRI